MYAMLNGYGVRIPILHKKESSGVRGELTFAIGVSPGQTDIVPLRCEACQAGLCADSFDPGRLPLSPVRDGG
jgi:hypothetical protein